MNFLKPIFNKPLVIRIVRWIKLVFRKLILALGTVLLITMILSLTDVPYWQYYWLGTHNCDLEKRPDYIVLMGGGGMPSPDGLIRTYYTAGAWHRAPNAKIIIAIPADTTNVFGSPEIQMKNEIVMRGVDSTIIQFEPYGYNTISQALEIKKRFNTQQLDTVALRLVTTPEHMLRSVKVFRKVGFKHVGGTPAFEKGLDKKKLLKKKQDSEVFLAFRYNIWSYMQYEITVVREYLALAYYKLRGWI